MSFQEYVQKEKSIQKYYELVDKFYDGKSLEERTSLEDELAQVCKGTLVKKIAGREICFSMTSPLECPYQKKDVDSLYSCTKTYVGGYSHYESIELDKNERNMIKTITLVH